MEDLLVPRYEVIADYPNSPYGVGKVIKFKDRQTTLITSTEQSDVFVNLETFEKYPHLFRKLDWWEDRKPEEMPEYVKWVSANSGHLYVGKILETKGNWFKCKLPNGEATSGEFTPNQDFPATLSEYLNQNKK